MNSFAKVFFIIIVTFSIIPVAPVSFLPIAPENFFIYLFAIYCFFRLPLIISKLSIKVTLLISLFIFYLILDVTLSFIKGIASSVPYFNMLRNLIKIILFILTIENSNDVKFTMKVITIAIAISTLVGLLIHFIGEPFQSLRMFLLNNPEDSFLGKGDRIAGLNGKIPAFAYQVTTGTVLAFGIYLAEKKKIWILIFCLLLLGIIYNGERAGALMFVIGSCGLVFSAKKHKLRNLLFFSLILFSVLLTAFSIIEPQSNKAATASERTLLHREYTEGENIGRLYQQFAGLKVFLKNPLIGGTDAQYQKEMQSYFKRLHIYPEPHNHYINVMMSLGIMGFVILISFFILLFKLFQDIKKDSIVPLKYYNVIFWAMVSNLGVALFHNHGIFASETSVWLILCLIIGSASLNKEKMKNIV